MSQLQMLRPNLVGLREMALPHGYQIRTYRPGDEAAWAEIINDSLGPGWDAERCRRGLIDLPQFCPDGLFFATYKCKPIGTTCAWTQSSGETRVGSVHMVGVIPEHQGKRLGYALSLSALRFFRDNGFQCARLSTDDFRLPAIKTYLNLGFEPKHTDKDHKARWDAIFAKLA